MAQRGEISTIEAHTREHPTPTKSKLEGAIQYAEYLQRNQLVHTKQRAFDFFNVPRRTAYRILAHKDDGGTTRPKTKRGIKSKLTKQDVEKMEQIINSHDINQGALSWQQLAVKAGLVGEKKVHFRTVRAHMLSLEYHKCIACPKNWLAPHIRAERRRFARQYQHWKLREWQKVRFTAEIRFGLDPQEKKLSIIRRPGERYCFDCIQYNPEPAAKNKKVLHAWAAVGWNYKTPLMWYTTSDNNGKMSQKSYIEQILEPIVLPWLEAGEDFILEEDDDSGHGAADNNSRARRWKKEKHLNYYINASKSPDLSVVENAFQPLKQELSNTERWDEEKLFQRANEAWKYVSYEYINNQVASMEERMQEVLDSDGRMIGH